jgi:hypothetical protein
MTDVIGTALGTLVATLGGAEALSAQSERRSLMLGAGLVVVGTVLVYVAQRQKVRA